MTTESANRLNGVISSRLQPGWVVTGTHSRKGDVIGRVAMISHAGGVLLDLDDGRIAGFNADESARLVVVQEVDAQYDVDIRGGLYLSGWTHVCGSRESTIATHDTDRAGEGE